MLKSSCLDVKDHCRFLSLIRLETKVDKNYAKELPNPFHIKHKETKVMIQELIAIVRFPIDTLHRAKRRNTKTKNSALSSKEPILLYTSEEAKLPHPL